jgi:hypothetical protein
LRRFVDAHQAAHRALVSSDEPERGLDTQSVLHGNRKIERRQPMPEQTVLFSMMTENNTQTVESITLRDVQAQVVSDLLSRELTITASDEHTLAMLTDAGTRERRWRSMR